MAIIIGDDVVLSAADAASGINGNNPRIGYQNVVAESNVFADLEDADFPVVNLANPATYIKWRSSSSADQHVGVHLAAATTVNYAAIVRHNLGTIGSQYVIESSTNGSSWTARTTPRIPADDYVIMVEFPDVFASHFRVTMSSNDDPPEIAVLMFGQVLRLQRRLFVSHTPIVFGRNSTVSVGVSEEGEFLGRTVRRRMYETSVASGNITGSYYREKIDPFFQAAVTDPFVFAWRPMSYPNEVAYAWLNGDGKMVNQRPNGMVEISFQMEGIR